MIDTAVGKFSRIDYACNIAGLCITGETSATSTTSWDKLFQVNARGTWLCQKYQILQMQKQDPLESPDSRHKTRGSIVNVSSMAGRQGQANLVAYGASKHAVIGFSKADGMRYGRDLIRINAVCPGAIKTPMLDIFASDRVGGHLGSLALQRAGDPEEVAECIVWLSSHRASYVTATTLSPHGGEYPTNFYDNQELKTLLRYDGRLILSFCFVTTQIAISHKIWCISCNTHYFFYMIFKLIIHNYEILQLD